MSVRIKICGVTSAADACRAVELGADAVGINFCAGSPREVTPTVAETILHALPPFVEAVGVFLNQPLAEVWPIVNRLGRIRTVQWHGANPEMCDAYPVRYVPAFNIRDTESMVAVTGYLELCRGLNRLPAAILVDGHADGKHGGTGRTAPWELLADLKPGVPLILAGGLTPENVAEAIRVVRPYAVDVAGGVESAPGRKDAEKMRRFIDAAHSAM